MASLQEEVKKVQAVLSEPFDESACREALRWLDGAAKNAGWAIGDPNERKVWDDLLIQAAAAAYTRAEPPQESLEFRSLKLPVEWEPCSKCGSDSVAYLDREKGWSCPGCGALRAFIEVNTKQEEI